MARDAEAASYTLNLWQKLVSWAYIISRPAISIYLSQFLGMFAFLICSMNAAFLSAGSSWLYSTSLPDDCYPSSHVNTLLQLLYILATLEAVLSPVCTVGFIITISRRETTCTGYILVLGLIAVSTVVAAVVLALQTLALKSSLNMQAILRIRPDLSSEDVLKAWNSFGGRELPLVAFIFFLLTSGFQVVAVSARHLIPSPKRLPKQFQPFLMEKQKRTSAIGEPEASTGWTELVAGVDSGPLARLFDDYEKQGLISTHIDLESFGRERRAFPEVKPEDGPLFVLSDRYCGPQKHRGWSKIFILGSTVYFLLSVGFETYGLLVIVDPTGPTSGTFSRLKLSLFLLLIYGSRLCILELIYPWPLGIWIVTVLISVRYRFALQRKVLGGIRTDRLLTISLTISSLIGSAYACARKMINSDNESSVVFAWWDLLNLLYCCGVTALILVVEIVPFLLGQRFLLL